MPKSQFNLAARDTSVLLPIVRMGTMTMSLIHAHLMGITAPIILKVDCLLALGRGSTVSTTMMTMRTDGDVAMADGDAAMADGDTTTSAVADSVARADGMVVVDTVVKAGGIVVVDSAAGTWEPAIEVEA